MWVESTDRKRKTVREMAAAVDSFARARWMLRSTRQGKRVRCYGRVLVEGGRAIVIGDRVVFLDGMLPSELRCEPGAELVIGPQTMFNYGVSIVSERAIRIGARCRFGSLVQIRDHDGRRTSPVVIGDDVWVAHGAFIEPGVSLGDGSVIAAGAVVLDSVAPRMLAVGNPARAFPLENRDRTLGIVDAPSNGITSIEGGLESSPAARGERVPAPSPEEVRAVIIEWLDDTRLFGEAERLITSDSMSLRERGLLDSLGLVELVLMLEARFVVTIDRDIVTRPEYQSMRAFIDLVRRHRPPLTAP
jgi:maltose O-acetyltransferase